MNPLMGLGKSAAWPLADTKSRTTLAKRVSLIGITCGLIVGLECVSTTRWDSYHITRGQYRAPISISVIEIGTANPYGEGNDHQGKDSTLSLKARKC
jgi:hypothetical protein